MKVFNVHLWVKNLKDNNVPEEVILKDLISGWPARNAGMTEEELLEKGFEPRPEWMMEMNDASYKEFKKIIDTIRELKFIEHTATGKHLTKVKRQIRTLEVKRSAYLQIRKDPTP